MILSSTSHWTYRCPLAPLSGVRWAVGIFASVFWFKIGIAAHTAEDAKLALVVALVSTQLFGTLSSALLMLRPRVGILRRVTDWYGIVTSVMVWVIGVAALISSGIEYVHVALLLGGVAIGVAWLVLIYYGIRPIRLDATGHE